ncbi:ATP-binding protein [Streptomyces sp. NPDC049954]|uniref:sensor histidine kinase n=1 Tax=Streptomyces sp. NPDC049954 TaxID=3155779 RepID=UPI0034422992
MTAPALTSSRERHVLRGVLIVAVPVTLVLALAVAAAAAAVSAAARPGVLWCSCVGAVLLIAAVCVARHALLRGRQARARAEESRAENGRLREELRAQQERLRQEAARESERLSAEAESARRRGADEIARLTSDNARLTSDNVRLAETARQAGTERAAALAATANAAARMQALASGMLADLRGMEEKHGDEEVLADLLHLDHRTAQAGRLADSVAVLTGARSGRRWARPIVMESVLRGAMGRISGYQRVRIHSLSDSAVAGHAAEGVMHALAELLDNAANFSPPTSEVHVYVEEVPAGVLVSIEDSGLVMGDVQLRRAERAVSGDIGGLGGLSGTRLGLAVVGRLALKHGLKVSFRPSARGGTGVLVLVPREVLAGATPAPALVTAPAVPERHDGAERTPAPAAPAARGRAARGTADTSTVRPAPEEEPREPAGPSAGPAGGLPRRRRGRTFAAAERARGLETATPRPGSAVQDPAARANRFSSFRAAVRGDHPTAPAPADTAERPVSPEPGHDAP